MLTLMRANQIMTGHLQLTHAESLFDELPNTLFYAKDTALNYVASNKHLRALVGAGASKDMVGRSARDFFPKQYHMRYESLDRSTLASGLPSVPRLSMSEAARGSGAWLLCANWPLMDDNGSVVGVTGLSRVLSQSRRHEAICVRVASAAEHLHLHYPEPFALQILADLTHVSHSQVSRDFMAVFGVSPGDYLSQIRMREARRLLAGETSISEIASACGYADQQSFTRRFRAEAGVSPGAYRKARREMNCQR